MNILPINPLVTGLASPGSIAPQTVPTGFSDFGSLIGKVGTDAVNGLRDAEQQSIAALKGGGSVQDVAAAVMSAEQSLQVAVSIRDKIVSAYLEISRMAI